MVGLATFASYGDKPELVQWIADVVRPLADPVPHELAHEFQVSTLARPIAPGLLERMVEQSLRVPARAWRGLFDGLLEDDFSDRVGRIAAPVLLLVAAADAYAPAADAARLQHAIRHARSETWAGAGHALHWEEPQRCATRLDAFAREVDAQGSGRSAGAA